MAKKTNKTAAEIEKLRTDLATILAREAAEKAAALARGVTDKAAGLTREQEQAATVLAEQRGRESARVEERLNVHDDHFKALDLSVARFATAQESASTQITVLTAEIRERNKHMTDDAAEAIKDLDKRIDGLDRVSFATQKEKTGIIGLQNRQIAFLAAVATVVYTFISSGIHP
jgi:hypothetical protein